MTSSPAAAADVHTERALLRSVLVWARANATKTLDIDVPRRLCGFDWTSSVGWVCVKFNNDDPPTVKVSVDDSYVEIDSTSVRHVVDILAALGVIPAEFSSAYRQHALDMWAWAHDTCTPEQHKNHDLFQLGQCDGAGKLAGCGLQLARYWQEGHAETIAWVREAAKEAPDADL